MFVQIFVLLIMDHGIQKHFRQIQSQKFMLEHSCLS